MYRILFRFITFIFVFFFLQQSIAVALTPYSRSILVAENKREVLNPNQLEKLAQSGDINAQYELGEMYYRGKGVPQKLKKSKHYIELAAMQGHVDAQYRFGFMYRHGIAVKQDYKKAKYFLELATEQGNSEAPFMLGLMYQRGTGVKQSYTRANFYLELAAERGHGKSQNILDRMGDGSVR